MLRRKFFILFGVMAIFAVASPDAIARSLDLTGNYDCEGRNADGGVYRGEVEIVKKRDVYLLRWRVGQNDTYDGVGILTGDVLSVSYHGGMAGIVVYTLKDDQTLAGRWAIRSGDGRVFIENLTRRRGPPQPPR